MDFAAPPQGARAVDHQREPCPHRIVDDCGGAFGMGAIGGSIWHFVKGARNSPQGARFIGAIDAVKVRAPALGGSFAVWGGLFSMCDCSMQAIRHKEDPWNSIISGAATGGLLATRSGVRSMGRNAVVGGALLALIEGVGIWLTRYASHKAPGPEEMEQAQAQAQQRASEGLAAASSG